MSLQVWLPLMGNLNNQGLDGSVTVTNNGATVDNNGKIGKCYSFNSTYLLLNKSPLDIFKYDNSEFTLSCFVYLNSIPSKTTGLICANRYYTEATGGGIGIALRTTGEIVLMSSNNTTKSDETDSSILLEALKWYHLTYTYDGSIKKLYVNGILKFNSTSTVQWNRNNQVFLIGGNPQGGWNCSLNGKLNDVRIYDHCLSVKEVKEISQGLICHYKLDDPYIEPTTNLCGDKAENFTSWSSYGFGNYGSKSIVNMLPAVRGQVCKVMDSSTNTGNHNVEMATWIAGPSLTNEEKVTFSIFVKGEGSSIGKKGFIHIYNSNGTVTQSNTLKWFILSNSWKRVEGQFTWRQDTNSSINFSVYVVSQIATGEYFYFSNAQLEYKDHVTPYTSNSRDYNEALDSSGYLNNGSIISNSTRPTIKSSSIRYNKCYNFTSSQYIACGKGGKVTDEITVSIWAKMTTWNNGIRLFSCTEGGGWNYESSNGYIQFPVYVSGVGYVLATSNKQYSDLSSGWHMFVGTYDGLYVRMYIDGLLEKETSNGKTTKTPISYYANNGIFIHAEATDSETIPATGYSEMDMSDFRIYATALSEEDIKDLYNNSASIDKEGNLHCYQLVEE